MRELLAPYGRWAGLAGAHALRAGAGAGSLRATPAVGDGRRAPAQPPGPLSPSSRPSCVGFVLGSPN